MEEVPTGPRSLRARTFTQSYYFATPLGLEEGNKDEDESEDESEDKDTDENEVQDKVKDKKNKKKGQEKSLSPASNQSISPESKEGSVASSVGEKKKRGRTKRDFTLTPPRALTPTPLPSPVSERNSSLRERSRINYREILSLENV